jgi:hypothetical protein
MMANVPSAALTVEQVIFATYEKSTISELALQRWCNSDCNGQTRRLESVNNCLSVVWRIPHWPVNVSDLSLMEVKLTDMELPQSQQLGVTTLFVVTCDRSLKADLIRTTLGAEVDWCAGGACDGAGELYAGSDPRRLLLVRSPEEKVPRQLTGHAVNAIRVVETLRHKIEGQFAEYTREFRGRLLKAERDLSDHLAQFGSLTVASMRLGDDPTIITLLMSEAVTAVYCEAALVHGPVRKIKAMLAANLRNMREAVGGVLPAIHEHSPGARLLRERSVSLEMLLVQVKADLDLIEPVLDAARYVGQLHHRQLLARLGSNEAQENRQRTHSAMQRETQNVQLVALGLWIGISQLWFAWLEMWPQETRPTGLLLLGWCVIPMSIGIVIYKVADLARRIYRRNGQL